MKDRWKKWSYEQRFNFVVEFSEHEHEASHLAQQKWGDIPQRLRAVLIAANDALIQAGVWS